MKMRRLLIHLAVGLALLSGSTVLADELVHFSFNKIEFPYQTVEVRKADGSTSSAEFASEIILLSDGRGNGGFGIWERGTPDTLSLFRVVSGSISVERRTGPFFEFKAQRLTPLPANEITVRFDPSPGNTPTGTVTFFIDGIPASDGSPLRIIAASVLQAIAPWLPKETREKLYAISGQTLWILFIALWFIQPLNSAFWDVVYTLSSWLGVEPHLGYVGYKTFRFWEHSAF